MLYTRISIWWSMRHCVSQWDTDTDTRHILCPLYNGVNAGGAGRVLGVRQILECLDWSWTGLMVESHAPLLPLHLDTDVPGGVPAHQKLPVEKTLVVTEKLERTSLDDFLLFLLLQQFLDYDFLPRVLDQKIYNTFKSRYSRLILVCRLLLLLLPSRCVPLTACSIDLPCV